MQLLVCNRRAEAQGEAPTVHDNEVQFIRSCASAPLLKVACLIDSYEAFPFSSAADFDTMRITGEPSPKSRWDTGSFCIAWWRYHASAHVQKPSKAYNLFSLYGQHDVTQARISESDLVANDLIDWRHNFAGSHRSRDEVQGKQQLADATVQPHVARMDQIGQWAAVDGLIAWTIANYGWKDFAANWAASARKAGIDNYFVACLDERCLPNCFYTSGWWIGSSNLVYHRDCESTVLRTHKF